MGTKILAIVLRSDSSQVGVVSGSMVTSMDSLGTIGSKDWANDVLGKTWDPLASEEIGSIAVSIVDGVYKEGVIHFLEKEIPAETILSELSKALDAELFVGHVGKCRCVYDKENAAEKMNNFHSVSIYNSVMLGMWLNDICVEHEHGLGGWIGYASVNIPDLDGFTQPNSDMLHDYVSERGLVRLYLEEAGKSPLPHTLGEQSIDGLRHDEIIKAAKQGDIVAQKALDRMAHYLGLKLSDLVGETSPEAIFLSGSMHAAGDSFAKAVEQSIEDNVLKIFKGKTKVLLSDNGEKADLLAAAAIVV